MQFYANPVSGNAHRVKNFLSILGVEHEEILVDLKSGAHKQPEFLALNPLGQVPVLADNDVTLRDSTAILVYLARKFDAQNTWLPKDPVAQAQVQQWLSTSVNEIQSGPFVLRLVKLLGSKLDYDAAYSRTVTLFGDLFEPHLSRQDWLVGNGPTIADIACYSYIACVPDGEFDLAPYPKIVAWLRRVEEIEGAIAMPTGKELFG